MSACRRDIGPTLQKFRDFLLGRKHTKGLRFEYDIVCRTQPPPVIPGGPAHLLHSNYYYKRDARCLVGQPIDVSKSLLPEVKKGTCGSSQSKLPTPGQTFNY